MYSGFACDGHRTSRQIPFSIARSCAFSDAVNPSAHFSDAHIFKIDNGYLTIEDLEGNRVF